MMNFDQFRINVVIALC